MINMLFLRESILGVAKKVAQTLGSGKALRLCWDGVFMDHGVLVQMMFLFHFPGVFCLLTQPFIFRGVFFHLSKGKKNDHLSTAIPSMYGIFTYIYHILP